MDTRLAAGTLALAVSVGCVPPGPSPSAVLRSPNGRYVVQLYGSTGRAYLPVGEHVVRAEVVKDGSHYINRRAIHSADWFDTAFSVDYVRAEWAAENALRFHWLVTGRHAGADRVLVVNEAEADIRFLQVKAGDLFILLDLVPGAAIELQATPQRPMGDLSWISVEGELADGTALPQRGVSFVLSDRRELRHQYRIVVREEGAEVSEVGHNSPVYGEYGR